MANHTSWHQCKQDLYDLPTVPAIGHNQHQRLLVWYLRDVVNTQPCQPLTEWGKHTIAIVVLTLQTKNRDVRYVKLCIIKRLMKFPISGIILDQADTKFLFNEVKEKTILSLLKQKVVALSSLFCHRKIEKNIHDTVKKNWREWNFFWITCSTIVVVSAWRATEVFFWSHNSNSLSFSHPLSRSLSLSLVVSSTLIHTFALPKSRKHHRLKPVLRFGEKKARWSFLFFAPQNWDKNCSQPDKCGIVLMGLWKRKKGSLLDNWVF